MKRSELRNMIKEELVEQEVKIGSFIKKIGPQIKVFKSSKGIYIVQDVKKHVGGRELLLKTGYAVVELKKKEIDEIKNLLETLK